LKITTRQFGEVELNEEEIVTFPEGLVGLEDKRRYVILGRPEEEPFKWLQCIDDPEIAFIIIDPMLFAGDYAFDIDDETTSKINLARPEDILLFVIVTLQDDFRKMTANLLGPIIVNGRNRRAIQMVLHNSNYITKHRIFPSKNEEAEGKPQNSKQA